MHYKGIYNKSFADSSPSGWQRHERGIFAGCTVSSILILAGMNIILEYSIQKNASQFLSNGVPLPLLRAFMDDFNLMSSSVQGAYTLLQRCSTALKWIGLKFRADKSRSIVNIKGRPVNPAPFSDHNTTIWSFSLFIFHSLDSYTTTQSFRSYS